MMPSRASAILEAATGSNLVSSSHPNRAWLFDPSEWFKLMKGDSSMPDTMVDARRIEKHGAFIPSVSFGHRWLSL